MNTLLLCPNCRSQVRPGARFCSKCGGELPSTIANMPSADPPPAAATGSPPSGSYSAGAPPQSGDYYVPPPGSLPQYGMPFAQQQPAQPQSDRGYGLIPYKNGQALTGYYMGCLGFVLPVLGPVAIVLGILGLMRAAREPQIKGQVHGIVAIVCGVLSLVLWLLLIFSWRGL